MVGYKPTRGQVYMLDECEVCLHAIILSLSLSSLEFLGWVPAGWEDCTMQKKLEKLTHGQVDRCNLSSHDTLT